MNLAVVALLMVCLFINIALGLFHYSENRVMWAAFPLTAGAFVFAVLVKAVAP